MGRNNTIAMRHIRSLCKDNNLNEKELYKNTKSTLSSYREICWTISSITSEDKTTIEFLSNNRTCLELVYWLKFVPKLSRYNLTKGSNFLYCKNFFPEIVEEALTLLSEYPTNGDLYKKIIIECYLGKQKLTENEILEKLPAMDRSTYYDRKKEAVLLFGIILSDKLRALSKSIKQSVNP